MIKVVALWLALCCQPSVLLNADNEFAVRPYVSEFNVAIFCRDRRMVEVESGVFISSGHARIDCGASDPCYSVSFVRLKGDLNRYSSFASVIRKDNTLSGNKFSSEVGGINKVSSYILPVRKFSDFPDIDPNCLRWPDANILKWEDYVDPHNTVVIFKRDLRIKLYPRPLLVTHDLVGLKCRTRCLDCSSVGLIGGPKSKHQDDSGGDGECGHDPLCKRIARANKRPDQTIPISSYLAVIGVVLGIGGVIGLLLGAIIEPKE